MLAEISEVLQEFLVRNAESAMPFELPLGPQTGAPYLWARTYPVG